MAEIKIQKLPAPTPPPEEVSFSVTVTVPLAAALYWRDSIQLAARVSELFERATNDIYDVFNKEIGR